MCPHYSHATRWILVFVVVFLGSGPRLVYAASSSGSECKATLGNYQVDMEYWGMIINTNASARGVRCPIPRDPDDDVGLNDLRVFVDDASGSEHVSCTLYSRISDDLTLLYSEQKTTNDNGTGRTNLDFAGMSAGDAAEFSANPAEFGSLYFDCSLPQDSAVISYYYRENA